MFNKPGIQQNPFPQGGPEEIIKLMVGSAVMSVTAICNEWIVQTQGKYLLPEEEVLSLLEEFQHRLAKRLMPAKTIDDIREEAAKFVSDILARAKEALNADSGNGEGAETSSTGNDATTGE